MVNFCSCFDLNFTGLTSKTDPYPYFLLKRICFTDTYPTLVKYSPDILKKKTKVLDIINMDKKCFIKKDVESSPQDI